MTEVVGIRFKSRGKVYYFDPAGVQVESGQTVVVETSKGLELGDCARGNYEVPDEVIVPPLRKVIRVATQEDLHTAEANKAKEKEAFGICKERIAAHGLAMKLVDVEYNFEGNKILFFFTSDGRVDFRELVKDLAGIFRMRIELRQIGVRDEAKMLGGLGICGRPYCCSQFLEDFQPVSTKMAKMQSMSLNPTKISGSCGRLMCCLRYEQDAYTDLLKSVPKAGTYVETEDGYGAVAQVNLLRQKVKVKLDGAADSQQPKTYDAEDVAVVPGGRPKPGETPPSLLKLRERPAREEEEQPEDSMEETWFLEGTPVSQEKLTEKIAKMESGEEHHKRQNGRRRGRGKGRSGGERPAENAAPAEEKSEANHPPKNRKPQHTQNREQNASGGQRHNQNRGASRQGEEGGKARQHNPAPKPRPEGAQSAGNAPAGEGAARRNNHHRRYGHRGGNGGNKPKQD